MGFPTVSLGFSFLGSAKSIIMGHLLSSFQNFVAVVFSPILFILMGLYLYKDPFIVILVGNVGDSICKGKHSLCLLYLVVHLFFI